MGIIIDIILIAIISLSAFLGYKKGLVKLGTKLFAGIIAIIVTIVVYKPVSGMIINNTQIDEKLENAIIQNTTSFIDENSQVQNEVTNQVKNEMLPAEAESIAKGVVYAVTAVVLFIVVKIILGIIISLLDFVANLPILKQFNEVGGIAYGIIRGIIIAFICILIIGVIAKINPESGLDSKIEDTYLTKMVYQNIIKF